MSLEKLFSKYLSRIDDLINRGKKLYQDINKYIYYKNLADIRDQHEYEEITEHTVATPPSIPKHEIQLQVWQINCKTLLDEILPKDHTNRSVFDYISNLKVFGLKSENCPDIQRAISLLEAVRDDLNTGMLGSLELQVEAEVASSYLEQAENLLEEGSTGAYDYALAAVLAGTCLERAIKQLCLHQNPPLPLVGENNKGKKYDLKASVLLQKLKDKGVMYQPKARQIQTWIDIRNKAAHGKFEEFDLNEVQRMIEGIRDFTAEYLNPN